jgi:hypothetical protein
MGDGRVALILDVDVMVSQTPASIARASKSADPVTSDRVLAEVS